MKIKETIERECCQRRDLKPVEGTPRLGTDPKFMFCTHCGRRHMIQGEMDAAGSRDWVYVRQNEVWDGNQDKS